MGPVQTATVFGFFVGIYLALSKTVTASMLLNGNDEILTIIGVIGLFIFSVRLKGQLGGFLVGVGLGASAAGL